MKIWVKTDGQYREDKFLVIRRDGTVFPHHFVLGPRDPAAPAALRSYAREARDLGMDEAYCASVEELANEGDKSNG